MFVTTVWWFCPWYWKIVLIVVRCISSHNSNNCICKADKSLQITSKGYSPCFGEAGNPWVGDLSRPQGPVSVLMCLHRHLRLWDILAFGFVQDAGPQSQPCWSQAHNPYYGWRARLSLQSMVKKTNDSTLTPIYCTRIVLLRFALANG